MNWAVNVRLLSNLLIPVSLEPQLVVVHPKECELAVSFVNLFILDVHCGFWGLILGESVRFIQQPGKELIINLI